MSSFLQQFESSPNDSSVLSSNVQTSDVSDQNELKAVVSFEKLDTNQEQFVMVSDDFPNNTLGIEHMCHAITFDNGGALNEPRAYSVLVSENITKNIHKSNSNMICIEKKGIISKIILEDFPFANYILSLNGFNCTSAKYDSSTGKQYFDFVKQSTALKNIINSITQKESIYIDLNCIDHAQIIVPSSTKLNSVHQIKFMEHEKNNMNSFISSINVYPHNTYSVHMNYVTNSITFFGPGSSGEVILMINDVEISRKKMQENPTVFKFIENKKIAIGENELLGRGKQNNYLSDYINKNTINFSRMPSLKMVFINCDLLDFSVHQSFYRSYAYPYHNLIFVD